MEKPIRIVHYNTGMDNGPCNGKPLYTDVWWLPKKGCVFHDLETLLLRSCFLEDFMTI